MSEEEADLHPAPDSEAHDNNNEEFTRPSASFRPLVVLLVLVGALVGFVVGRMTAPDQEVAADRAPLTFPSGDENRVGYWGWANLEPIVIDSFDRENDPTTMGETETGQVWEPVSGTWGVDNNTAAVTDDSQESARIAVVGGGRGGGLTEATMTIVDEGAGLVFRFLDPSNYWSVTANPADSSWTISRVISGETEVVREVVAPTDNGVTVSVTQNGAVLRLLVDGEEYVNISDGALRQYLQGGLIDLTTDTDEARWDRFLVMRFREPAATIVTTVG